MTENTTDPRPESSFSTPKLVGLMAGGILALVFLAAIVRGIGSGEPALPEAGQAPAGESGPPPPGDVRLVSPGDAVEREGLTFQWEGSEGLTGYEVTIYDPTMKRIWTSARVAGQSLEPPPEIVDLLNPGSIYQWGVTGFAEGDEPVRSRSRPFRLIE